MDYIEGSVIFQNETWSHLRIFDYSTLLTRVLPGSTLRRKVLLRRQAQQAAVERQLVRGIEAGVRVIDDRDGQAQRVPGCIPMHFIERIDSQGPQLRGL